MHLHLMHLHKAVEDSIFVRLHARTWRCGFSRQARGTRKTLDDGWPWSSIIKAGDDRYCRDCSNDIRDQRDWGVPIDIEHPVHRRLVHWQSWVPNVRGLIKLIHIFLNFYCNSFNKTYINVIFSHGIHI